MIKPCKHATLIIKVCGSCLKKREARSRWRRKNPDYHKNYNVENNERVTAQKREHYVENAERIKANQSARYIANPETRKVQSRTYRANNREAHLKRGHEYYKKNKPKFQARANLGEEHRRKERERVKCHNDKHPGQRLARVAARRATKLGVSDAERFTIADVIARDGLGCFLCGLPTIVGCVDLKLRPTIEHLKPLIVGGEHRLAATALAHFTCNCTKSRKIVMPGEVPVRLRHLCRKRVREYLSALAR